MNKIIAVICGNPREVRRAWYRYFTKFQKGAMLYKFAEKYITVREGEYRFYTPDQIEMEGQWFDEVIWYGTVSSHAKYRDVLDYVRLHTRKVGEF